MQSELRNNTNLHIGELMTKRQALINWPKELDIEETVAMAQTKAIIEMQIDEARRFFKNPLI